MRKTSVFKFLMVFSLILSGGRLQAAPSLCEGLFQKASDQPLASGKAATVAKAAEANLKKYENIFTRARDLDSYKMAFGKEFSRVLVEIAEKGGHWIDAGAGDAIAIQEFVAANPRTRGTAISVESAAESMARLSVIKGQFIEDIPSDRVAKARVVTDVIGGLAYSGTPHLVLRKYFDWLDAHGEVFVFMGTRDVYGLINRVITADGKYLNLIDWIKLIPGIKTEVIVETREDEGTTYEKWALRLTRDKSRPLDIPDVTLRELLPGAPPTMLFQEARGLSIEAGDTVLLQAQQKVRADLEQGLRSQAQATTFTQFMDSFRGGEITHPLVSAVKGLKPTQSWVNISAYGANLAHDLASKAYDASSDKVFFGISQKWIRFRVNAVKPEKFRYTHFHSGLALDKMTNVGVLTDFNGDFVSSLRPDEVLRRYIRAIGDSGTAFIYLGREYTGFGAGSDVLTAAGKRLSLRQWLKSIPGLEVKLFRGGYAYAGGQWTFVRIRKKKPTVKIPELQFLGADRRTDGEVPSMVFQEGRSL